MVFSLKIFKHLLSKKVSEHTAEEEDRRNSSESLVNIGEESVPDEIGAKERKSKMADGNLMK